MRKALWVGQEGGMEYGRALLPLSFSVAEVDVVRRVEAQAAVPMLGVVPGEEIPAVFLRVVSRAKPVSVKIVAA